MVWIPPLRLQLTAPSDALVAFAVASAAAPFSGHPPGRIEAPPPLWHVADHEEAIGQGGEAYRRAADALRRLDCMQLDWLRATVQGDVLAICSRQFGLVWLMNANRLLPTEEASGCVQDCVAMSWGTTARHVLAGEERLTVRWDRATDAVHFRVRSYSRPRHPFAVLAYPVVRLQQRRFARDAVEAMRRACG